MTGIFCYIGQIKTQLGDKDKLLNIKLNEKKFFTGWHKASGTFKNYIILYN